MKTPGKAYYNEFDSKAAAWLRELIANDLIADGDVDERSIVDVSPKDLSGYTQCHFFAGIGGWSYALRLADWSDDCPVWTGSCPCQPFSSAGQRRGIDDDRHIWPVFRQLIAKCKPPIVFGEQVASDAGRVWLYGVRSEMETLGYAVGSADLCAASVGAPHIRPRLYWTAQRVGYSDGVRFYEQGESASTEIQGECSIREGNQESKELGVIQGRFEGLRGSSSGWERTVSVACNDGYSRRIPIEPEFFPLAYGVSEEVELLRGYGNAIVPQLAATFIKAAM